MPKYQQSKQGYTRNPQNPAVMSDRKKAQLVARGYPHTNSVYTSPNPSEGVLKPRFVPDCASLSYFFRNSYVAPPILQNGPF